MEKKNIIIITAFLAIFGCSTFKSTKEKDFTMENKFVQQSGLTIPILTNEDEKAPSINIILEKIKNEQFLPVNGKQPELLEYQTFSEKISDSIERIFIVKNRKVIKIEEHVNEKKKDLNNKDLIVHYITFRDYYPDGNLRSFRVRLDAPHTDIRIGTWYRFDEQGNILQVIDHEKHFKTSFLDVYKIAKSYKRNCFNISRNISESKTYWIIGLCSWEGENLPTVHVIVDDNTGKVIEEINYSEGNKDKGSEYYDAKYVKDLYKLFD